MIVTDYLGNTVDLSPGDMIAYTAKNRGKRVIRRVTADIVITTHSREGLSTIVKSFQNNRYITLRKWIKVIT